MERYELITSTPYHSMVISAAVGPEVLRPSAEIACLIICSEPNQYRHSRRLGIPVCYDALLIIEDRCFDDVHILRPTSSDQQEHYCGYCTDSAWQSSLTPTPFQCHEVSG